VLIKLEPSIKRIHNEQRNSVTLIKDN